MTWRRGRGMRVNWYNRADGNRTTPHRKEARVSGKATLHHINGETRAPSGG